MMSKIKGGGFRVLAGIHTYIIFLFDLHPFHVILHFTKEEKLDGSGELMFELYQRD